MPGTSGIEAVEMAARRRPGLKIAFLSGLDEPQVVTGALQQGIVGWLPKSMPGEALINALNLLLSGERFFPADLLLRRPDNPMTPREQDVAALLARGLSDKEIADHLSLQVGTVKVHVKSLLRKFSSGNRTQFALRYRGL
jgi:DNA-binding NarL/FixJ family response regulator